MRQSIIYTITILSTLYITVTQCRTVTFTNQCNYDVWPASTVSDSVSNNIPGFHLPSGHTQLVTLSSSWNGRFYARTQCIFNSAGNGKCDTGDCGSLTCIHGGSNPLTLAELNLQHDNSYYDISMVDGFNIPMAIQPIQHNGQCITPIVSQDLNTDCPAKLQVKDSTGQVVACMSDCTATGTDEACCRGQYASIDKCKPTTNDQWFKSMSPTSYSYANDIATYSCNSQDWIITLCPTTTTNQQSITQQTQNPAHKLQHIINQQ